MTMAGRAVPTDPTGRIGGATIAHFGRPAAGPPSPTVTARFGPVASDRQTAPTNPTDSGEGRRRSLDLRVRPPATDRPIGRFGRRLTDRAAGRLVLAARHRVSGNARQRRATARPGRQARMRFATDRLPDRVDDRRRLADRMSSAIGRTSAA